MRFKISSADGVPATHGVGTSRVAKWAIASAVTAFAVVATSATGQATAQSDGPAIASDSGVDRYIVQVADRADVRSVSVALPDSVDKVTSLKGKALNGLVVHSDDANAIDELEQMPGVVMVEPDGRVEINGDASSWGVDRIDQPALPLDGQFTTELGDGQDSHIYVLDTGITETAILAGRVGPGADFIGDGYGTDDCHGHGTHVAGTAAGTDGYGVAPAAMVYPVRVLDCGGYGSYSGIIAGMNWIAANAPEASVANASLGGWYSESVNIAVENLIAAGVPIAVAAGNSWDDACYYSPASAPNAVTVAASDEWDYLTWFSNYGECVDIAAPGEDIASMIPDGSVEEWDGTSMASPHVAGALGLFYSLNPQASSDAGEQWLQEQSVSDIIEGYDLLNVKAGQDPTPPPPPPPASPTPTPTPIQTEEPTPIPDAPTVEVAKVKKRMVKVKWASVAHAESYQVQVTKVKKKSRRSLDKGGSTTNTKFKVKKLRPGSKYQVTVTAKGAAGDSAPDTVTVRTKKKR
ncbi:MAG: S8 family serine peptidase [Actinomycetia bacterium]|nr:S8 family serine peptidase [Actinomycetes bacterium]